MAKTTIAKVGAFTDDVAAQINAMFTELYAGGAVSGLGTGVATALAVATGASGGFAVNGVAGVAAGYKVARGVASITGSGTVVTGLATVVAVIASPASDPDGVALAAVSGTIGDQAGTPAAGSVILKAWKVTAVDDATLIAATAAKSINWIAIGT